MEYKYHATALIAEELENEDLTFQVRSVGTGEMITAKYALDSGPLVSILFISRDDDNDVAIRGINFIKKSKEEKRDRVLQACNHLNSRFRYAKFCLQSGGDVDLEFDLPIHTDDSCVGAVCCELLACMVRIMEDSYPIFMQTIFTDMPMEDILSADC